jgi:DNA-binding transcriptional LysR family regulator
VDIRHLRYVVALADELHFGRAAKRLNVSQPPLSQQLMQLEEELGVRLFDRTKHKVAVTAAGTAFAKKARSVLALVDHAATAAAQTRDGEIEHLTISTLTSTNSGFYRELIKVVERFAKHHPTVRLSLRTMTVPQQIQAIRENRIQIGFVHLPIDDPAIGIVPVYGERMALAIPQGHPLASERYIPASALGNQRQIGFPRGTTALSHQSQREFRLRHGFRMNALHEARTVYDSLLLVSADIGVFLVPASFADVPRKGIVIRKIKPSSLLQMGVAYRKENPSPAVLSFLSALNRPQGKRDTAK